MFASDALSSVAYATEAILGVLILYGIGAINYQFNITLAICALIAIVAFSYEQTIREYPAGGGSYIVASKNLGRVPGLLAGGALLIDYILTVAVSVAAGVAALISAYPVLHSALVWMSLAFIFIVAWANLRGVRESGAIFALPTYGFVLGMLVMLIIAFFKSRGLNAGQHPVLADPGTVGKEASYAFAFIILRAFAAGCTALTGVEAVSDGVLAFKAPESKNAIKTLRAMALILVTLFFGIGYVVPYLPTLSLHSAASPEYRTVVSQIASWAFGAGSLGFYYLQFVTAAILILAANTAFADFPRLASFLARDGFVPRSFARQGDRLVFQNGIITLSIAAAALVVYFKGRLDHLLPLYAVGVFMAFTLSQSGMIAHWLKNRPKGWARKLAVNILGAIITGTVMLIILVTKLQEGAWIVLVLLAALFVIFNLVRGRYDAMARQLSIDDLKPVDKVTGHTVLLLVPRMHRGILQALEYARTAFADVRAIHIMIEPKSAEALKEQWEKYGRDVPLVILESPYRSLIDPLLDYVDDALASMPGHRITVIVPEAVSRRWYHKLLHEPVALQLKLALGSRKDVVLTSVRYFLE